MSEDTRPASMFRAPEFAVDEDEPPLGPDWTTGPDGRSNTSVEFIALRMEIERLIRGDAFKLIAGRADQTAGLILAQLAHKHGVGPLAAAEERGRLTGWREAGEALRDRRADDWRFEDGRRIPQTRIGYADYLAAMAPKEGGAQ